MSLSGSSERFKRHAVPLAVFAVVLVAVLVAPPVFLGEATGKTYALTAAILVIAVGTVFPYAILVALGTLPLLYVGVASFATPEVASDTPHQFSAEGALRHLGAGISYVLAATTVGAIGIGAQLAVADDATVLPAALQPSFMFLGGGVVGGAFVCLQLWRYDTPLGELDRRTVLGTVALGGLLTLSPAVAFWIFSAGI